MRPAYNAWMVRRDEADSASVGITLFVSSGCKSRLGKRRSAE